MNKPTSTTEPPKPAPTKAELEAMHGTPKDFSTACFNAVLSGDVSLQEASAAIRKYEREWSAAK